MTYFDCNAFIGSAQKGTWNAATGRAGILAAMDDAGIARALIWHVAQQDWSVAEGNALLSEAVGAEERLWGCWTILPPHTGEIPDGKELFRRMRAERIRAVRIFPTDHRFVAGRTALGSVLDGCIDRRVPLFVSIERGATDYAVVDRLLGEFPRLRCVLCDVGIWGVDRYLRPLLARHAGVRVETSYLALHDGVLESLVRAYGAERFLFGTGFPDRLPASAMLTLRHAEITDAEKRSIAGANLESLVAEVKL